MPPGRISTFEIRRPAYPPTRFLRKAPRATRPHKYTAPMNRSVRAATGFFVLSALLGVIALQGSLHPKSAHADEPLETVVQQNLDGSQFVYVVFHALDRDGFCASRGGSISLHPVINMPVDFIIES